MKHEDTDIEPYTLSDTPLAAYLHFRGLTVLATKQDPHDRKRKIFVFVDDPSREQFERDWADDVDGCRSYFRSLKTVQHMIFDDRNQIK